MKNKELFEKYHHWWQKAVIYQIYPQSFYDTNNDGIGDLTGIVTKMDYLSTLGVDLIWLCPIYKSPMVDNGYDVSDYYAINPMFGTMTDFELLVATGEKHNIKIMMDIVLNHTSSECQWFLEAQKGPENKYYDYYIWRDKPGNERSIFGGVAWTYVPAIKKYYFHQFALSQPDLNWSNPAVRAELAKIINFWIKKGVMGFRFDVIDLIGKEIEQKIYTNGPNLHKYIKELRKNSWGTNEIVTVGECWGADIEQGINYSKIDHQELSMIFQFEHISFNYDKFLGKWKKKPFELVKFIEIITKWQRELHHNGWNSIFLENHDLPRAVSTFGNSKQYWEKSAKLLAGIIFSLEGTPYIYQGQEIGMQNLIQTKLDECQDVEIHNLHQELVVEKKLMSNDEFILAVQKVGRDNARTPMQWNNEPFAGFSTFQPWIQVNDNYHTINVIQQIQDENSIFKFYQKLIHLRKNSEFSDLMVYGKYKLIEQDNAKLFLYSRRYDKQMLLILSNWSDTIERYTINHSSTLVMSNYEIQEQKFRQSDVIILQPWEFVILEVQLEEEN